MAINNMVNGSCYLDVKRYFYKTILLRVNMSPHDTAEFMIGLFILILALSGSASAIAITIFLIKAVINY